MAFKWASYPAAGPGKWKCKFKEHYSLLAFWTWPCISLLTTLTESYLQLDSLIAIPSLSEILQACHWGISVIKCQRPQQLAESRTPTSSHICQSDTLISPPALFHFPSSLARLFFICFLMLAPHSIHPSQTYLHSYKKQPDCGSVFPCSLSMSHTVLK